MIGIPRLLGQEREGNISQVIQQFITFHEGSGFPGLIFQSFFSLCSLTEFNPLSSPKARDDKKVKDYLVVW